MGKPQCTLQRGMIEDELKLPLFQDWMVDFYHVKSLCSPDTNCRHHGITNIHPLQCLLNDEGNVCPLKLIGQEIVLGLQYVVNFSPVYFYRRARVAAVCDISMHLCDYLSDISSRSPDVYCDPARAHNITAIDADTGDRLFINLTFHTYGVYNPTGCVFWYLTGSFTPSTIDNH